MGPFHTQALPDNSLYLIAINLTSASHFQLRVQVLVPRFARQLQEHHTLNDPYIHTRPWTLVTVLINTSTKPYG
jgi:hypothetical protein